MLCVKSLAGADEMYMHDKVESAYLSARRSVKVMPLCTW